MMKNLLFLLCCLCFTGCLRALEGIHEFDYPEAKIIAIQDRTARFPRSLFSAEGPSTFTQTAESYEASINVFLIVNKNNGAVSLIDAGNGEAAGGMLLRKLRALKIDPGTIKAVFITHIHPDHVGGLALMTKTEQGLKSSVCFPSATVYIAKEEYDAWKKDPKRARLAQFLAPCTPERLQLFEYEKPLEGDFGTLIPHKAAGHTPGHTVFEKIISDGKMSRPVYFVGDLLHAADLQITHSEFCAGFDQAPATAVAARNTALRTYDGSWFGAHFPFPGKIKIVKETFQNGKERFSYVKEK